MTTADALTDAQIYDARDHARRRDDHLSVALMAIALERDHAHPAVRIARSYTADYLDREALS